MAKGKFTWTCTECGKRGTWAKGWCHLWEELRVVWCSATCCDAAQDRWGLPDEPAGFFAPNPTDSRKEELNDQP